MSRRRTPRPLRPEEAELWRRVAESARPLQPRRVEPEPTVPPPSEPAAPEPAPAVSAGRLQPFRIGELRSSTAARQASSTTSTTPPASLPPAPPRIDRKAHQRLTRGKSAPEARLDLHGFTLAEAQPALAGFLQRSQAAGRRLVLVITGKGRDGGADGIMRRAGALRREVPLWLSRPPLADRVQHFTPAHSRHGGEGALYVWLRRRR